MNISREERIKRKMAKRGLIDVHDAKVISSQTHEQIAAEEKQKIKKEIKIKNMEKESEKTNSEKEVISEKEVKADTSAPVNGSENAANNNPFKKPVISRDYTKQPVDVTGKMPDSIPEPEFKRRVIDMEATGGQENNEHDVDDELLNGDDGTGSDGGGHSDSNHSDGDHNGGDKGGTGGSGNDAGDDYKQPKIDPLGNIHNPAVEEMDDKEAKKAANDLVDSIMTGIDWMSEILQDVCTTSKTKLQNKALKGEFDMTLIEESLTEEEGGGIYWDCFESLNDAAAHAFKVSEQWKENVRNPLREVLLKKGLGVTPEQQLLLYAIQLASQWVIALIKIKTAQSRLFHILKRIMKDRADYQHTNTYQKANTEGTSQQKQASAQEETIKPPRKDDGKVPTEEKISETVNS